MPKVKRVKKNSRIRSLIVQKINILFFSLCLSFMIFLTFDFLMRIFLSGQFKLRMKWFKVQRFGWNFEIGLKANLGLQFNLREILELTSD